MFLRFGRFGRFEAIERFEIFFGDLNLLVGDWIFGLIALLSASSITAILLKH